MIDKQLAVDCWAHFWNLPIEGVDHTGLFNGPALVRARFGRRETGPFFHRPIPASEVRAELIDYADEAARVGHTKTAAAIADQVDEWDGYSDRVFYLYDVGGVQEVLIEMVSARELPWRERRQLTRSMGTEVELA